MVLTYLDGWLIRLLVQGNKQCYTHPFSVNTVGCIVNQKKNSLTPFLGLKLDSCVKSHFSIPGEGIRVPALLGPTFSLVPAPTMMMVSIIVVFPLGRLLVRLFQRWVLATSLVVSRHLNQSIQVSPIPGYCRKGFSWPGVVLQCGHDRRSPPLNSGSKDSVTECPAYQLPGNSDDVLGA